jgi:hypothetical protein
MEPVTVISLIMTCVLVFERVWKYTISHIKKSKCCGNEIEFENQRSSSSFIDVAKI